MRLSKNYNRDWRNDSVIKSSQQSFFFFFDLLNAGIKLENLLLKILFLIKCIRVCAREEVCTSARCHIVQNRTLDSPGTGVTVPRNVLETESRSSLQP